MGGGAPFGFGGLGFRVSFGFGGFRSRSLRLGTSGQRRLRVFICCVCLSEYIEVV